MTEPTVAASIRGVNHLALVRSDMARTVDFYTNVLGFPLVKTVELPAGWGQHFFESAAWTKVFDESDVRHAPATAASASSA
jgi:catechol 2,3-dioxygenase-like lactoylglutathione lyase family enzyme